MSEFGQVGDAIFDCGEVVGVERRTDGGGYDADGIYQEAVVAEEFDILAVVQELSTDELDDIRDVREGRRTEHIRKFYTQTRLFGTIAPDGFQPDILQYNGDRYEIMQLGDWNALGGYWKIFAVKVGQ